MRSTRRQLAQIGVRKPIWNNEINYGVAGGGATTRTRYCVDKQQSYVIRTYVLSAAARMQRTYWLGWFRTRRMAVHMADDAGRRRPPATSYEVVRSWLNRTVLPRLSPGRRGPVDLHGQARTGEVRRIYWKPRGGAVTVRIPARDAGRGPGGRRQRPAPAARSVSTSDRRWWPPADSPTARRTPAVLEHSAYAWQHLDCGTLRHLFTCQRRAGSDACTPTGRRCW